MTAPVKPAPATRPIYYRPIERHWYRLVDFVQYTWHRPWFRWTVVVLVRILWVLLRLAVWLAAAAFIVGFGVLFVFLSTCLGSSSMSKSISRASR
jgi:hypothetical protein